MWCSHEQEDGRRGLKGEGCNKISVLIGMLLGNRFPFLLLNFSTYIVGLVLLLPAESALRLKKMWYTRPKHHEVSFQSLDTSLQPKTHHFCGSTVPVLSPATFRHRLMRTVASSCNTHVQAVHYAQFKKTGKKLLHGTCYFGAQTWNSGRLPMETLTFVGFAEFCTLAAN